MRFPPSLLSFALALTFFSSCGNKSEPSVSDSTKNVGKSDSAIPKNPAPQNIEAKTFEVIDSLGKSHGWGYDLYVNEKKTIHQPMIPAVPGNNSFASQADAEKIGALAAEKMKKTGSLPTISVHDLDSLGIQHLK